MSAPSAVRRRRALEALNFFMADMQAGIGPFLGIYLAAHGWRVGLIGTAMTLGGVAGMLVTAPAGALVDRTFHKRWYVVGSGVATVTASALILWSQSFAVVAVSQVATAIAGAAIGPAVVGITLGMVGQRGFVDQNGRNQAWNHAGNMIGAALSGLLGWKFGLPAVFGLAAVFGIFAIWSVLSIPAAAIDDRIARGLSDGPRTSHERAEGFAQLLRSKPLLVLAAALACFHFGNGGMLPLYGLAIAKAHQGNPAALVALTIVVAQAVMIPAALLAARMADRQGLWLVMLVTFVVLPIRGAIAAGIITWWGVFPVEILDGVGAGLQSVAVPALVVRFLDGSGRVNVGQGAVMTVQGVGAALSPAFGSWLAQALGFHLAFAILGSTSLASIVIWVACAPLVRRAAVPKRDDAASAVRSPGAPVPA